MTTEAGHAILLCMRKLHSLSDLPVAIFHLGLDLLRLIGAGLQPRTVQELEQGIICGRNRQIPFVNSARVGWFVPKSDEPVTFTRRSPGYSKHGMVLRGEPSVA